MSSTLSRLSRLRTRSWMRSLTGWQLLLCLALLIAPAVTSAGPTTAAGDPFRCTLGKGNSEDMTRLKPAYRIAARIPAARRAKNYRVVAALASEAHALSRNCRLLYIAAHANTRIGRSRLARQQFECIVAKGHCRTDVDARKRALAVLKKTLGFVPAAPQLPKASVVKTRHPQSPSVSAKSADAVPRSRSSGVISSDVRASALASDSTKAWLSIGVGGALLAGAVLSSYAAWSADQQYEARRNTAGRVVGMSLADAQAEVSTINRYTGAATGLTALGGTGVALGVAGLVGRGPLAISSERRSPVASRSSEAQPQPRPNARGL